MRKRMLLLSLGFPARDHYERAAQRAMQQFHWLILKRVSITIFLFAVFFVLTSSLDWFVTRTVIICVILGIVLRRIVLFLRSMDEYTFLTNFIYRARFSDEIAPLCRRAELRPIEVFFSRRNTTTTPNAAMLKVRGEWAVIVWRSGEHEFTQLERRGAFAHELGHLLLPLDLFGPLLCDRAVFHAREFAADAIGACLLGDARPVLLCLNKAHESQVAHRVQSEGSFTHPPLAGRTGRLLDLNFHARHTR